jgi:hypothetical protein
MSGPALNRSALGRLWAGKFYDTNTGNLSAEIDTAESKVAGIIRFMDDRFGVVGYATKGTFDGSAIKLSEMPSVSWPAIVQKCPHFAGRA